MVEMKTVKMKSLDGEEVIFEIVDEQARNDITILEDILNDNGLQFEILWENASPTSSFAGQTIATGVTATDYQYVMAVFNINSGGRKLTSFAPRNWYGEIQWIGNITSTTTTMFFRRTWTLGNSGNFILEDCTSKQGSTTNTNNPYLIPYALYGIKGVQ